MCDLKQKYPDVRRKTQMCDLEKKTQICDLEKKKIHSLVTKRWFFFDNNSANEFLLKFV